MAGPDEHACVARKQDQMVVRRPVRRLDRQPEEARPQQVGPDPGAHRQAAAATISPSWRRPSVLLGSCLSTVVPSLRRLRPFAFAPFCPTRPTGDSPLLVREAYDVKRFAEHLEDIGPGQEARYDSAATHRRLQTALTNSLY